MGEIVAALGTCHTPYLFTRPPDENAQQLDQAAAVDDDIDRRSEVRRRFHPQLDAVRHAPGAAYFSASLRTVVTLRRVTGIPSAFSSRAPVILESLMRVRHSQ